MLCKCILAFVCLKMQKLFMIVYDNKQEGCFMFLVNKFYAFLIFLIVGISLYFFVTFFGSTQSNAEEDVLVVGTNSGFPPYELINDSGDLEGFDIDVAKEIAKKLNKKLEVKDMSFDSLIISLKQGKIDLILAGMSITKSRLQEIEMVHYHGKDLRMLPLVFWKEIPHGVKSIYDLKNQANKTVCVQSGTIQEEFVSKFDFISVKNLDLISDLIMEIKYGKAIACVLEPYVVVELKTKIPEIKILDMCLSCSDQTFGHGIGIKKDNKKLTQQVFCAVDQLKKIGCIEKLEKKWFSKKG